MSIGESVVRSVTSPPPEYVIYSFLKRDATTTQRGSDNWQNMGSLPDLQQARDRVSQLLRSSRYSRIELRKKCLSEKTGVIEDIPLEVYGLDAGQQLRDIIILLSLALGCACVALVLAL